MSSQRIQRVACLCHGWRDGDGRRAGSRLSLWLWGMSLSSPEALAFQEYKSLKLGGMTSLQAPTTLCPHPLALEEGLSRCEVIQLLCSLFSFGRTSFLPRDCCLWRRRLSCVKASTRLLSQNGVPVTQPLMFAQLECFCPKEAGSQAVIHPVGSFPGEAERFGGSQPLVATHVRAVLSKHGVQLRGGGRLFGDLVKGTSIFFTGHVLGVPLKG